MTKILKVIAAILLVIAAAMIFFTSIPSELEEQSQPEECVADPNNAFDTSCMEDEEIAFVDGDPAYQPNSSGGDEK